MLKIVLFARIPKAKNIFLESSFFICDYLLFLFRNSGTTMRNLNNNLLFNNCNYNYNRLQGGGYYR
jgi:hypothetical protein